MANMQFSRKNFPSNFVFGAATSAYQIEGQKFGDAGACHWDTFSATPGNVIGAESGLTACEHFLHYESDFDLMRALGLDAYRFSTNWSRVMPDGRTINTEGLDFYDRLVDAMLARGLKPFCTLYHWDLPSALADKGGWRNADIPQWFTDYARIIARRLGDRVETISTINEPWCVSYLSHFLGIHAPGLRDIRAAARSMHYVMLAHGTAIQALRADGHDNLGIVLNFTQSEPLSDAPEDIIASERMDAIQNTWFLEATFNGTYPDIALEGFGPHLPDGWEEDLETIKTPIDWLGVNYYTRNLFGAGDGAWPSVRSEPGPLPKTSLNWEIYPDGLAMQLKRASSYSGYIPIYIAENGMAWDDKVLRTRVIDAERIDYYDRHIRTVARSIEDGVPVAGYFCWSLLDNYEWAEGYAPRFGLIHVDFETQKRTPKASYYALQKALAR